MEHTKINENFEIPYCECGYEAEESILIETWLTNQGEIRIPKDNSKMPICPKCKRIMNY